MERLAENARRYFGDAGVTWLAELPTTLERIARDWELDVAPHYPGLSINYVAPALTREGTSAVLKLCVPCDEVEHEIAALRCWHGEGAARLLRSDSAQGALLLERLEPGTDLVALAEADDDAATRVYADVARSLWRPPPASHGLRPMRTWFRELLEGGREGLFKRAVSVVLELLSAEMELVVHGDLHHFNILQGRGGRWLAIDPKGLVGDPLFDVGAFLRNPDNPPETQVQRRFDIICHEMGLDRDRARSWVFAESMLQAAWCRASDPTWLSDRLEWAELTLRLK